jgi:HTH-type transcriptional regulator, bacterioopsin transcriptional activator and related proteins
MSLEETASSACTHEQYESLLDAAETYREALVIRCCGEVGLRPSELSGLTVDAIDRVRTDPPRYLVRMPDEDGTEARRAYLPTDVERELRRYARSNGRSSDDPVFSVTPRRLQMLVAEVAARASERTANPALADVSTSDLRRFFARTALVDHDVNPRAVKAAGGWGSFEALEPFLPRPTDTELVDAFAAVESDSAGARSAGEISTRSPSGETDLVHSLLAASDRYALVRLDADGYVERWNRSAESTFGYRAGEIVGTHVSTFYTADAVEEGVPGQTLSQALEASGCERNGWRVREDGSRFRATELVVPCRDDRRRLRGFAVLVRDVSAEYDRLEDVRSDYEELRQLYDIAERHRALTGALLDATEHEEVEAATCRELADGDAYDVAWIDRTTFSDHTQQWRTASGLDGDRIDRLVSAERPSRKEASADDSVSISTDVRVTFDDGSRFDGRTAAVPLRYGETVYGTLSVAAERTAAFSEAERAWLTTVGRQVGYAIAAVRRRNLLLSDRIVELEFSCRDDGSFFVEAARQLDCRFELDSLVLLSKTTQLYYVRVEGASPADVFALADADPGIDDCRLIETGETACRIEFVVEGSSPTLTLTEYGATVREAVFEAGEATITAECAADADLRTIVSGLRSVFPDSELIGKRDTERPVQTGREFREGLEERLTGRQEAALKAAYSGGYYDWPRESTAEEIADAMGISSPTLHSHLRKGQRELLRTFFDEPETES